MRFAVLSDQPRDAAERAWTPFVRNMARATGLDVRPVFLSDAGVAVSAMRSGRLELGLFTNLAALEAVRKGGGEVFAKLSPPADMNGDYALLIAPATSRVTLARVLACDRSLSLGLGEASSISGALAQETYLFAPRGLAVGKCFRRVSNGGAREILDAVAAGRIDLGASSTSELRRAHALRLPSADRVREIWRSPVLPQLPLVWRKDLDPAIKEKLRQFFLTYGVGDTRADGDQRARLTTLGIAGFEPADDSHLLPVREMEATQAWQEAEAAGDKARIQLALGQLDAVRAEREALEARTRAPAAAQ